MNNIGYINLPRWRDYLQSRLIELDLRDMITFPVLGKESVDAPWRTLEQEEFYSYAKKVLHFADGKRLEKIDRQVITTDSEFAVSRLYEGKYKDTFFSGAIGSTFSFNKIVCAKHLVSKPVKMLVQNDAVISYILSRVEYGKKSLEEAIYESQWEKISDEKPFKNLHGIVSRNRFILQTAEIFGVLLPFESIYTAGINNIDSEDVKIAHELGFSIRLLGIAEKSGEKFNASVEPCLIPKAYLLAQARGGSEIIYVKTDDGLSQVYGCPGTSNDSCINGVLYDLYDLSESSCKKDLRLLDESELGEFADNFYIRFELKNITSVLSSVLRCFDEFKINLLQVNIISEPIDDNGNFTVVAVAQSTTRKHLSSLVSEVSANIKGSVVKSYFRYINRA